MIKEDREEEADAVENADDDADISPVRMSLDDQFASPVAV